MSFEDEVKHKHALQAKAAEIISLAEMMTNEEIELALARLADMLGSPKDERKRSQIRYVGNVLQAYFDDRKTGKVRLSKFKRFFGDYGYLVKNVVELCPTVPVRDKLLEN